LRRAGAILLVVASACGPPDHFPHELVSFVDHPANPVFTGGPPGDWDTEMRERGFILRDEQGYRLWYTASCCGVRPLRLGHARSSDGISWVRDPEPLVGDLWIEDVMVVRYDGEYIMVAEGAGHRSHWLTSPDGLAWISHGRIEIHLRGGAPIPSAPYGTPTLFRAHGLWYLFYEILDDGIWVATSTDLRAFTNVSDLPVLPVGPDEHDAIQVALNQVIEHEGVYYAYYNGLGRRPEWTINIARSTDLVHWHKYARNPVLPAALRRTSGHVVRDGHGYRLYTTAGRVDVHLPAP
jgi:hypothetical protein